MIDPQKFTPLALNSECKDLKGVFLPFHDDIELMQFTGLHDKDGKEIWEGDILKYKLFGFCLVEYVPPSFTLKSKNNLGDIWYLGFPQIDNLEVIGNIYENRELLGK